MKQFLLLAGSVLLSVGLNAQVGINAGQKTDAPIAKDAVLQVANKEGEHKGVLFPQMKTSDLNKISSPTEGLMIYNTTLHCLQIYNGSAWECTNGKYSSDFTYNGKTYDGQEYVRDQKFGDGKHDFIYKVITGPDGKQWLNNNLGADYANVHSSVFNPDQQAKDKGDYHAYGSSFQWGRVDDTGYELMNWTGTNSGSAVYTDKGWYSNSQLTTYNDPCPSGFHTPKSQEFETLRSAIGSNPNDDIFASCILRLPAASSRTSAKDKGFGNAGTAGYYWSSTPSGDNNAKYLRFNHSGGSLMTNTFRSYGDPIRCIHD